MVAEHETMPWRIRKNVMHTDSGRGEAFPAVCVQPAGTAAGTLPSAALPEKNHNDE